MAFRWHLLNLIHFPNIAGPNTFAGVGRWAQVTKQQGFVRQYMTELVVAFGLTEAALLYDFWRARCRSSPAAAVRRALHPPHQPDPARRDRPVERVQPTRATSSAGGSNWIMYSNWPTDPPQPRRHWTELAEAHRHEVAPRIEPRLDEAAHGGAAPAAHVRAAAAAARSCACATAARSRSWPRRAAGGGRAAGGTRAIGTGRGASVTGFPALLAYAALAIFWLNTLLIAAAGWGRCARLVRRWGARARAGVVVEGTGPEGQAAIHRVRQVGRSKGDAAIWFHDRAYEAEVLGGVVAVGSERVGLAGRTVWVGRARERAAACPPARRRSPRRRGPRRRARPGGRARSRCPSGQVTEVWLSQGPDGPLIADFDPRRWRRKAIALTAGLVVEAAGDRGAAALLSVAAGVRDGEQAGRVSDSGGVQLVPAARQAAMRPCSRRRPSVARGLARARLRSSAGPPRAWLVGEASRSVHWCGRRRASK